LGRQILWTMDKYPDYIVEVFFIESFNFVTGIWK